MASDRNPFRSPRGETLVGASILSADFANLERDCAQVLGSGADFLHLDVMDGHFVPNLTMGPDLCRGLRGALPDACLDVHLMVERPGDFVESFAKAGADHFCFHIESAEPDPGSLVERVHDLGMTAGLAINPDTEAERLRPLLEKVEMALVMSVYPGFSGQSFIPGVLPKAAWLKESSPDSVHIEIDGGVKPTNSGEAIAHGVNLVVAASAIFGVEPGERADVVSSLKSS
ncbi:MAG: ribulose-phosphate 3-epimerase [Planctomycetota bacterium]